ncbi:hypothetical protein C8Q74DRAFT_258925 [Fomes fomentarius]|nr:hypothetical protein C8Q74DRAFT_258925 [Fomes fomentarius]
MVTRDVENYDAASFDDMLKFMLEKVDNNQSIDPDTRLQNTLQAVVGLCNGKGKTLRTSLAEYCQVDSERGRYSPFVCTFNIALSYLKDLKVKQSNFRPASSLDILFCRNAENEIHGSHVGADDDVIKTRRKPDILLTSKPAANRAFGLNMKSNPNSDIIRRLGEQPPGHFTWHDVLSAWEFKRHSKTLKNPPTSFDTALHGEYETMAVQSKTLPTMKKTQPELKGSGPKDKGAPAAKISTRSDSDTLRTTAIRNQARKDDDAVADADSSDRPPPGVQCALYGAEMLSRAPAVSHALVMLIQDSIFRVWWYDHQGAIQTTGIDFVRDLPRFLALLFALQRFELRDWGRVPEFDLGEQGLRQKTPSNNLPPTKITGRMGCEVEVYTAKHVHKTLGLKGRGTYVVESQCVADDHPLRDTPLVTKLLWAECTRLSEGTIVQHAIAQAENAGGKKITDHMPKVVDEYQYGEYNTLTVRERLRLPLKVRVGVDGTERKVYRVLRVITMERLEPLHMLTGPEFVKGWLELMQAHYLNWCNGIQHKDISLNNLMYRRKPDNTPCAVLNDWDLSSVVTEEKETYSGFELTGTVPFMAIDLLTEEALAGKVRHLYRHDLESFLWVFLWVVHCCLNGQKLAKPPFEKWSTPDVEACRGAKWGFLRDGHLRVKPTASWTSESPLAFALIGYLRAAEQQQSAQVWAQAQRARGLQDVGESMIKEEDVPDDVWKGFLSVTRDGCEPELHDLLDLADLKLE